MRPFRRPIDRLVNLPTAVCLAALVALLASAAPGGYAAEGPAANDPALGAVASSDSAVAQGSAVAGGLRAQDLVEWLTAEELAERLAAVQAVVEAHKTGHGVSGEVIAALVNLLADSQSKVSQAAASALEAIGEPALPELSQGMKRFSGTAGITARRSIAQVAGRIGAGAVPYLIAFMDDASPQVRRTVILALEGLGKQASEAVKPLSEVLMDVEEDADVRVAAAGALRSIGASDEESLLALVFGRVDVNLRVAFAANTALSSLRPGTSALLASLLAAIENPEMAPRTRDALVWVFETYGDAVGATLEYLRSGTVAQRLLLAQELPRLYGRLKPDRRAGMVEILKAGLDDESADVRSAVIVSLAGLDESAEALIPVLSAIALDRDGDLDIRRAAIRGWELTGVCPPDLAEELVALAAAEGEDQDVRQSAVNILAAAGPTVKDVAAMVLDNLPALSEDWQWRLAPAIVEAGRADQAIVNRLVGWLEAERLEHGSMEAGQLDDGRLEDGRSEIGQCEARRPEAGPEEVDRLYAIRVLSAIGSHAGAAVPALINLLTAETDPLYRRAITRALVEIAGSDLGAETGEVVVCGENDVSGADKESGAGVHSVLAALADDTDDDVRRIARTALGLEVEAGSADPVPAFPGAEGFGMWTRGGRGGDVYVVTNLNDSGPGSLRAAVEASGPRIVVFAVSGTIHLKSRLDITKPFITIAGQTAPGDGITIADYAVVIKTNDVILRNVRFRLGDKTRQESDTLWIDGAKNVIVDHVSSSWSVDESLSVSSSDNVTVQWCFITESLHRSVHSKGAHGYGSLVRGEFGSKYSFHHNLWAHHSGRMPRPGNYTAYNFDKDGLLVDFRNNVFYNWGGGYSGANHDTNSITMYNFVNNYYKRGPNSSGSMAFREECPYAKAYFAGNLMNGVEPKDPWSLVDARINRTVYESTYKQSEPFPAGFISTEPAAVAYERVLAEAGAHPRDEVDARVAEDVLFGRGRIIDSQEQVGGWPMMRSEALPADSNGDSVPDWWHVKYGFDPTKELDLNGDLDCDGYTNIEEYLNGTDPDQYVDWTKLGQ
jgi:HEAT repeat protein